MCAVIHGAGLVRREYFCLFLSFCPKSQANQEVRVHIHVPEGEAPSHCLHPLVTD